MAGKKRGRSAQVEKETAGTQTSIEVNLVTYPLSAWFGYIKQNIVGCYAGMLAIALTAFIATVAVTLLLGGVVIALIAVLGPAALGGGKIEGVAAGLVVFIMGNVLLRWAQRTFQLTALIFIDSVFSKSAFDLLGSARRIAWPVLRLVMLDMGLMLVVALPALILFATMPGLEAGMADAMTSLLVVLYVLCAALAYLFLTQFWPYGIVLEGKSAVESLKSSFSMATSKLTDVAMFNAVWVIGMLFFGIPYITYTLNSNMELTQMQALAGSDWSSGGAYLMATFTAGIISAVLMAIVDSFATPTHYLFWKAMKGK